MSYSQITRHVMFEIAVRRGMPAYPRKFFSETKARKNQNKSGRKHQNKSGRKNRPLAEQRENPQKTPAEAAVVYRETAPRKMRSISPGLMAYERAVSASIKPSR